MGHADCASVQLFLSSTRKSTAVCLPSYLLSPIIGFMSLLTEKTSAPTSIAYPTIFFLRLARNLPLTGKGGSTPTPQMSADWSRD